MRSKSQFAAELIRTGAGAFAGFAASALLDAEPDLKQRYGRRAFAAWKAEIERLLTDLAAALDAGEPAIFASQIAWSRDAFVARHLGTSDLRAALACARAVLNEELPKDARPCADETFALALDALDRPSAAEPEMGIGSLASAYLLKTLEGDRRGAIQFVLDAVSRAEIDLHQAYTRVLIPAQRQIGEMWHRSEVNVAEEHFTTMTTQAVMAILSQQHTPKLANSRTVVAGAVAGDAHDVGVRAVADFFEHEGWRTIYLGPDVPTPDLALGVEAYEPDLLVLSATLPVQLPSVERAIKAVRARTKGLKILVGGGAFANLTDVHSRLGADALGPTIEDGVSIGARLVGLDTSSN